MDNTHSGATKHPFARRLGNTYFWRTTTVRVTSKSDGDPAKLRFEVIDAGIGIPTEAQGKLFQAFTQADNSTTSRFGGTRLGLAICRQLVHAMRGEIGVGRTPGKGSTFWFVVSLPVGSAEAEPELPDAVALVGRHAIIVDDHLTNLKIIEHHVRNWGMTSTCYSSPNAALEALRNPAPDAPTGSCAAGSSNPLNGRP